jgi:hypothetical protein
MLVDRPGCPQVRDELFSSALHVIERYVNSKSLCI